MDLQTEFEFTLPKGYVDSDGTLHQHGTMRLSTAADEILPLRDPRVQQNPAYLTMILLSRVVTRLGELPTVSPKVVEGLFSSDLAFLQDLYNRLNGDGQTTLTTVCPQCQHEFEIEVQPLGGQLSATP